MDARFYAAELARGERFMVRDNWEGRGYRLYIGNDAACVQIDGEVNGRVFRTVREAREYCKARFGHDATRERY